VDGLFGHKLAGCRLQSELASILNIEPFERKTLSGENFEEAQARHNKYGSTSFYRPLDRLHLAPMKELSTDRLVTNDLHR
jgi:hypothetical protein